MSNVIDMHQWQAQRQSERIADRIIEHSADMRAAMLHALTPSLTDADRLRVLSTIKIKDLENGR